MEAEDNIGRRRSRAMATTATSRKIFSKDASLSTSNQTRLDNFLNKMSSVDIFAFVPVPKAQAVSTKRSLFGSCGLLIIFFSYLIYTFITFLSNNVPRSNQYLIPLDSNYVSTVPEIAFAFVNSDSFTSSFYNTSYFTYNLQQCTVYQNTSIPRNYTTVPYIPCQPTWLNVSFPVFCPNTTLFMQGILYGTPIHQYPRLQVNMCMNSTANNYSCATNDSLTWVIMTGRLFVYIRNYPELDLSTGQNTVATPYNSYYYFFVYSLYNRAEVVAQRTITTLHPNLMTSFSDQIIDDLDIIDQNTYVSQVPQNVSHNFFLWWIRLDETTMSTDVMYATSTELFGQWGGMWSILFAMGAVYFLKYNTKSFYKARPEWEEFDKQFSEVQSMASGKPSNAEGKSPDPSLELSQMKSPLLDDATLNTSREIKSIPGAKHPLDEPYSPPIQVKKKMGDNQDVSPPQVLTDIKIDSKDEQVL
jgi:hypothetical protein